MKRLSVLIFLTLSASAQSGGPYEITQSVTAGGGGTSGGGSYSITGSTAQSIAGVQSSNGPYSARGGFWQFFFAPTAAEVSVTGRVTDAKGRPIARVRVMLEGSPAGVRSAVTNGFGYFHFDEVEIGRTYIIAPVHKTYEFTPSVLTVHDRIDDLEIVALP